MAVWLAGRGRSRKLDAVGTVTITLRDEDRHFIKRAMEEGRYVRESEAVADALSELRAREELRQARLGELREKIAAGSRNSTGAKAPSGALRRSDAKGKRDWAPAALVESRVANPSFAGGEVRRGRDLVVFRGG